MRYKACALFDAHEPCGAEANMAKLLAAEASWEAANACLQFHGGFGFAREYDVERKFRETRLYQVAPISTNLILSYVAEHVLGLPRLVLSLRPERTSYSRKLRRAELRDSALKAASSPRRRESSVLGMNDTGPAFAGTTMYNSSCRDLRRRVRHRQDLPRC